MITEHYYCPLTGCAPLPWPRPVPYEYRPGLDILIPCRPPLPAETTDEQAEHHRALEGAVCWSRDGAGRVVPWTAM